jgi:hypothetical protein
MSASIFAAARLLGRLIVRVGMVSAMGRYCSYHGGSAIRSH